MTISFFLPTFLNFNSKKNSDRPFPRWQPFFVMKKLVPSKKWKTMHLATRSERLVFCLDCPPLCPTWCLLRHRIVKLSIVITPICSMKVIHSWNAFNYQLLRWIEENIYCHSFTFYNLADIFTMSTMIDVLERGNTNMMPNRCLAIMSPYKWLPTGQSRHYY